MAASSNAVAAKKPTSQSVKRWPATAVVAIVSSVLISASGKSLSSARTSPRTASIKFDGSAAVRTARNIGPRTGSCVIGK